MLTKRAFILYFMVLSERGHHVHQTNGGFVYVGLNADCSRSLYMTTTKQHTVPVAYFFASIKTNNYNKFDGIMQTNLSRDKVEIVIRFTPFQTNHLRARNATGINRLR